MKIEKIDRLEVIGVRQWEDCYDSGRFSEHGRAGSLNRSAGATDGPAGRLTSVLRDSDLIDRLAQFQLHVLTAAGAG